jgi:hypothetical protein
MPLRPAIFCGLLLAGCATHAEQSAPQAQQTPAAVTQKALVTPAGMAGIVLAMRPVPAERPGPARVVLAGLGTPGSVSADHVYEFIVRTESGTTISIVQPRTNDLHTGEQVSILRGASTRIDARASD